MKAAVIPLMLCSAAASLVAEPDEVPSWVQGERETLVLKKPAVPAYMTVTQSATIIRPKALTQLADLEKLNPGLSRVLPSLRELLGVAKVSAKFKALYDEKITAAGEGDPLEANEYFDCATVLNFTAPKTGRKALLFQSDMQVDTDGTDPVRKPRLTDYHDALLSHSFQPVLAYSWEQSGSAPAVNPFIGYYKDTLGKLRALRGQVNAAAEKDPSFIWEDLGKVFNERISKMDRRARYYAEDLRQRRSLIASLDPFIVVPQSWVGGVQVGDYVAVIYAGQVFPCIIGDTGPDSKAGEASQRLARAIDPKASGRHSAVTTSGVTYIVFPGTRSAMGAPDLAPYHATVSKLLGELGGLGEGATLHRWE